MYQTYAHGYQDCSHGVRLLGPNPPPCIQCELIWCETMHSIALMHFENARTKLEDIKRRISEAENAAR